MPSNPCPGQAITREEFDVAFSSGTLPRFSPYLDRWVAVGSITGFRLHEPGLADCSGLKASDKFAHLLVTKQYTVEVHRPEGVHKTIIAGNLATHSSIFSWSPEKQNALQYSCRFQTHQSRLLCKVKETNELLEFRTMRSLVHPPSSPSSISLDSSPVQNSQIAAREINAFDKSLMATGVLLFIVVVVALFQWLLRRE